MYEIVTDAAVTLVLWGVGLVSTVNRDRLQYAYRHSVRSGRTSVKDFIGALYDAHEVYPN